MSHTDLLKTLYANPGDDKIARKSEESHLTRLFERKKSVLRIALMGCTGSIGKSTIDVVRANPDRLKIVALAAGSNADELSKLANELGVNRIALSAAHNSIPSGVGALRALAAEDDIDVVVNAVVGAAGFEVTLGALDGLHDIALANKESLVMAGELVMRRAMEQKTEIAAIDSEHSSLASCLRGRRIDEIRKVTLTASGGPFRGRPAGSFNDVTVQEALAHPTWRMGPKITIDSATLMNKGLEIIEAHHLFGLPAEMIDVVVHPQSIIHAMVEHADGTVIAEMAPADMKIPIQRALLPDGAFSAPLDLFKLPPLTFERPDREAFPLLDVAYDALKMGGTAPAVLNAANEIAVGAFLEKKIRFGSIFDIIRLALVSHKPWPISSEQDVYEADRLGREAARKLIASVA